MNQNKKKIASDTCFYNEKAQNLIMEMIKIVPFTGWTETSFQDAYTSVGLNEEMARGLFPFGALDVAKALHRQCDDEMIRHFLLRDDVDKLKLREKIIEIIMIRFALMQKYKKTVQASVSFFAFLPNSAEGMALIWQSADKVWNAVGDSSDDFNFYSKRVIFSAVYVSSLVYWLGDDSSNKDTYAFVCRRVENIMQFEKGKLYLRRFRPFVKSENCLNAFGKKLRQAAKARYEAVPASLNRQKM